MLCHYTEEAEKKAAASTTPSKVGLCNRHSDWSTLYDCMCIVRWYNTRVL